jgi:hypothetical protein
LSEGARADARAMRAPFALLPYYFFCLKAVIFDEKGHP